MDKTGKDGERKKGTCQACSPKSPISRHRLPISTSGAEFLDGNANERAHQGADGGNELGCHGGALGKAGLDQQRKVADLVGDLVEEDGDGGGGADGGRGVEAGGHGQAVGDVVGEVSAEG